MLKVYLAHSISTRGEFNDSKITAQKIRDLGYEVYVASENDSINDKTNEPTPMAIYKADIGEIMKADIVVVNISGGLQDGTISEVGATSGINEVFESIKNELPENLYEEVMEHLSFDEKLLVGYTTNARLLQPQFSDGISSGGANHLVKGMIDEWGIFPKTEEKMLKHLENRKKNIDENAQAPLKYTIYTIDRFNGGAKEIYKYANTLEEAEIISFQLASEKIHSWVELTSEKPSLKATDWSPAPEDSDCTIVVAHQHYLKISEEDED